MKNSINNEKSAKYNTKINAENKTIEKALNILHSRMLSRDTGITITSPDTIKNYIKLKLSMLEHEVFSIVLLDNRHNIINYCELFTGTIDGANVYPREVLKTVLANNAAAVIFVHNHPSGNSEPSRADEMITKRLNEALKLIDVRVLDHLIVGENITSFAEHGLI